MMFMTDSQKPADVKKDWIVVDATDVSLGRLASVMAFRLRGKHKASFTPHVDGGDNIIIINAEKVRLTGHKLHNHTFYWHTGYPGGIKSEVAKDTLERHPERLVERAVKRMLPRTKLGRQQFKNLHVYAGAEHPHGAQKPTEIKLS
ncbi:MAG: 50S ribosomal protein L13 [Alphaproteobacteria bacterium]|nr:50S ribosomal protein L13 [Alphaproteobacteria bacterium]MDD9919444.1 50S ribosomal protein L13 [Alphaproteobacteria bacterium]